MSHDQRDAHLFGPGPKRILALDGGGIRGIVSLAILEKVEALIRERHNAPKMVLSDYFDLIAGTSTGSIIATLLALGKPVSECIQLYEDLGPRVFAKPRLLGRFLWSKFDAAALEEILNDRLKTLSLNSVELRTGLLITCKRIDTGSAWIQCNNRRGAFWKYDSLRELRQLVRASTAAPTFFKPAELQIGNGDTGLFLDGAMGGHNNPSLAAFLYATVKEYELGWATGDENLMMLSVGTGYFRPRFPVDEFKKLATAQQGVQTLMGLIHETSVTALTVMQAISSPNTPFQVNSEVKGLEQSLIGGRNLLAFERLDASLEWDDVIAAGVSPLTPRIHAKLKEMDIGEKETIRRLSTIGAYRAASITAAQILPRAFDLGRAAAP